MPTTPYALLRVSVEGGAWQTGEVTAAAGSSLQFSAAEKTGWNSARWTVYAPPGMATPSGWTLEGSHFVYDGATEDPPVFDVTADVWGKVTPTLLVNGGVKYDPVSQRNVTGDPTLTYTLTVVKILSPSGADTDIAPLEETEFDSEEGWAAPYRRLARVVEGVAFPGGVHYTFAMPASGVTDDDVVFTVPALPAGAGRFILSTVLVRVETALVGSGNVKVRVGSSVGGQQFILEQTLVAATSAGTIFGLPTTDLGADFLSADQYNAKLAAGATVNLRQIGAGTITTPGSIRVTLFGKHLN